MTKKFITLALISLFVLLFYVNYSLNSNNPNPSIAVNGQTIYVDIADNEAKREQGLSGRKSLPKNNGMLFIFPAKGNYSFWMKDMNFPLDFIWLEDNKIVDITENAMPEGSSPGKIYHSKWPVNKVLEINSGVAKSLRAKIGNDVKYYNVPN